MPINLGAKKQVNYLEFDGVNNRVETTQNIPSYPFTIEANALSNTNNSTNLIFAFTDSSGDAVFGFGFWDDGLIHLRQRFSGSGGTEQDVSSFNYNANQEYNIRYVFNSSTNRELFIDNVLIETFTSNIDINFNSNLLFLGLWKRGSSVQWQLNGSIYDFKIYDDATQSNLILHYDFSDGSGTTLTDISGNNNDGTIVGATWAEEIKDNISKIFRGNTEIVKAFRGTDLIFQSFEPIDPSTLNPLMWMDASDTSTITASSGSVSQWNNKGSLGNFTQSNSSLQPTTGVSTLNGLNVLDFSADVLRAVNQNEWKFLNDGLAKYEVFIVMKNTNLGQLNSVLCNTRHSFRHGIDIAIETRGNPKNLAHIVTTSTFNGFVVRNVSEDDYVNDNTWTIFSALGDLTNSTLADRSEIRKNNNNLVKNNDRSTNAANTNPQDPLEIGGGGNGSFPFSGSMAEIIIINGNNVTNQNRNDIYAYLSNKWGI